jgi:hypothetical protein
MEFLRTEYAETNKWYFSSLKESNGKQSKTTVTAIEARDLG